MVPYDIFISYAHKDKELLDRLAIGLRALEHEGLIHPWHDRDITPGDEWHPHILAHLNTAHIILLLISPDFIASQFCYSVEMVQALKRHDNHQACVIPILIRPTDWKNMPFAKLQALPTNCKPITTWPDQDEAFLDIAQRIRRLLTEKAGAGRSVIQGTTGRERETMPRVKVLFLAANPTSADRLAIDEQMRAIEQKVRATDYRDVLVFQSNGAVRPDDLLQLLNQHRPQIVHFSGHGSHAGLSLAGNDGQARLVTTQALASLFATLKDNIRLVFLNACYSREQAQALVTSIDCVIGMKESIGDNAAIAFASSFYRAIGFGRSLQEAFDQGKTSLLLEGIQGEDIPELLVKDGINPSQVVLIGHAANPF